MPPRKVHITQHTLDELGDVFKVEPLDHTTASEKLQDLPFQTYFVADKELETINMQSVLKRIHTMTCHTTRTRPAQRLKRSLGLRRRMSVMEAVESWGATVPFDSLSDDMMEKTLPNYEEVNKRLEVGFGLDKEKQEHQRFNMLILQKGMHAVSLKFTNSALEKKYMHRKDSSFRFYIICAFSLFLCLTVTQAVILGVDDGLTNLYFIVPSVCGIVIYAVLISTTSIATSNINKLSKTLTDMTECVISNSTAKHLLTCCSCFTILLSSILPMIHCISESEWYADTLKAHMAPTVEATSFAMELSSLSLSSSSPVLPQSNCIFAPYYLYSCMLVLVTCSVFLRVLFIFKLLFMCSSLLVFNLMIYVPFSSIFSSYDEYMKTLGNEDTSGDTQFLKTSIRGTLYTSILFLTLVLLDRQIEASLRLDFLCTEHVRDGEDEVKKNELLNEILLENILPKHVANNFMKKYRNKHEVYHDHCRSAYVMFAAIPNFKIFFSDVDIAGKECLRMLNEIVSCFDQLLIMRFFDGVEKIKTIGSTYMAVSGLDSHNNDEPRLQQGKTAVLMVRFAFKIMQTLADFNRDALSDYKLRIGICHGEVIAGVVGAQKPQYDTWGDTVNVASRMESSGVIGRIQVPEKTAKLLTSLGIPCEYRGEQQVKGKGRMKLYLVFEDAMELFNSKGVRCDSQTSYAGRELDQIDINLPPTGTSDI